MWKGHLGKNFKLCLVKLILFCFLSSLIVKDVLSANKLGCEIQKITTTSPDCYFGNQMVNPDSRVTRNCSIRNGETTFGKTWEQVKNGLKLETGLVLKAGNSTTRIYLTRPLKLTYHSTSPRSLFSEKTRKLRCYFKGKPRPSVVWYKDGKRIMNGTEGFYHTEKLSENYQDTLEATILVPGREENEGYYTCTANNSICGWSSEKSSSPIQVIYRCPITKIQVADSSDIDSTFSSNSSLSCLVVMSKTTEKHCRFRWYSNNTSLPVQADGKYKAELKPNHSKCKKNFSLTVINTTFNDEGRYSCHQICKFDETWFNTSANIKLHVYTQPVSSTSPTTEYETTSALPVWERSKSVFAGGSKRKWIFPIISISACGVFVLIIAVVVRYVKKKRAHMEMKCLAEEGVTSNKLFISYSSKDFPWVTENLIALLDKHSIPYSIHARDFELGKPIVQNMADSVYNSRQVLIVLSDNYLASNFCREELHMAVQRGIDSGDSSLVLVLIDKFKKKRLPGALRNKVLLEFEKHKTKQDWEEKLLQAVFIETCRCLCSFIGPLESSGFCWLSSYWLFVHLVALILCDIISAFHSRLMDDWQFVGDGPS